MSFLEEVREALPKVKPARLVAETADGRRVPVALPASRKRWASAASTLAEVSELRAVEFLDAKGDLVRRLESAQLERQTARTSSSELVEVETTDVADRMVAYVLQAQTAVLDAHNKAMAGVMREHTALAETFRKTMVSQQQAAQSQLEAIQVLTDLVVATTAGSVAGDDGSDEVKLRLVGAAEKFATALALGAKK